MSGVADFLLAAMIVAGLYMVATSRLGACVRASAVQGIILGALPMALWWTQVVRPLVPARDRARARGLRHQGASPFRGCCCARSVRRACAARSSR